MISDEQIDSLPDDPDAAFVQYEAILREAVRGTERASWDAEREYVAHILAFVDTRGVPIALPRDPPPDSDGFSDWYKDFVRTVDYHKVVARLQVSARKKVHVSVLTLSPDFKVQIGGHLTAIRKIVAEADVPENKRDAIFRRINNLQDEVDRDRTRTEAAMALWLDVTSAISKGAKNLDPAIKRLERIIKVLANAKDENEHKALTSPRETKRLAPPTTVSDSSDSGPSRPPPTSLDDEIPF